MVRRLAFSFALLAVLALYACKKDDDHPPAAGQPGTDQPFSPIGGSSGSATEGSGPDQGDSGTLDGATFDGGQCTDVTLTGVLQDEEAAAQAIPAGTGGTIADGTYDLSSVQKYTGATGGIAGPTGVEYRSTIRITSGTSFERDTIVSSNASTGPENRSTGIIVSVGVNTTITFTCPTSQQEQYAYTATSTSLILTNLTTGESYTYTLKL